ncbi:hypothetical protein LX97_03014 [Nonlabens dokdonensis]|uniref:Uncharacterized protein n=2 Tax=Nonlabens dokdonensis TaxID=328515 RepID=L7WGW0_NONDD|nr:tetratricopeptide repeat protein [Nonlabens dokdonensis]AGC78188.1 uncharacterized protein DDD_3061 [Nonlabens dokdonensis DSW-6]PZX37919.1 hypothetical protein LX97_03014 [Nonlabens dokdonensis]
MKKQLFFITLFAIALSGCKSKSNISNTTGVVAVTNYENAKRYLANAQYDQGLDAIEKAIDENERTHLDELYFLKGFILHAYGETTDARLAYQQVIDMEKAYSPYKTKALQLLELNIKEEKWRKENEQNKDEKETFSKEEVEKMDAKTLPFQPVDELPRFTSCPEATNMEVKKCFNEVIRDHLVANYNSEIGNIFGIYEKVRTYISFKVDIDGQLIDLQGRSQSRFLTLEAKRVIFTLPKMLPGRADGKNVKVPFAVPVTYAPIE